MSGTGAQERTVGRRQRARRTILLGIVAVALLAAAALLGTGCSDTISAAQQAESDGDLKTAEALYHEQLQSHSDDVRAVKGLAGILYLQRRWDEALTFQEKAVALDPKEAQIRVELGFNYLNHQNDPGKAVTVFREAVLLQPTAQYLSFLGQAEAMAEDLQAAEGSLRQALATDAKYAYAYTVLISLLEKQGRSTEAAELRAKAESQGIAMKSPAATP